MPGGDVYGVQGSSLIDEMNLNQSHNQGAPNKKESPKLNSRESDELVVMGILLERADWVMNN